MTDETKPTPPTFNQVISIEKRKQSKQIDEKQANITKAIQEIEKAYGKRTVFKLGENFSEEMPHLPFGLLPLDIALGVGGLPKGRMVEIFGPESSGKTTLCLANIAVTQKNGGVAAFVDAEHALDASWAKKLGVNIDELLVAQPDCGEDALEITESLVRSNSVDIIVVDSVAALTPRAEIEGSMGDSHMGLHARLMSQACRKLTGAIANSNTTVVFINQIRSKIGIVYGSPEVTTGGNALKFYASVRMDVRKIEAIKKGEEVIGNRIRVKVVKNKVSPPFREAIFDLFFARGFDNDGSIFDFAVKYGIIEKSGTWYSYNGNRLGQGKTNAIKIFKDSIPEILPKIQQYIKESKEISLSATTETEEETDSDSE